MRELLEAVKNKSLILFAGGGISSAIGLPSYESLITHLAQDLGEEADEFMRLGDFRELAEYYILERGSLGPLRSWMDVHWHGADIDISQSRIHRRIVELNFPIIYTTNYDRWLERAFDKLKAPYTKIANVRDLLDIKVGRTQIVKFHGDFDDDTSLVFTESSYLERLELESPLDIKLRADILGKSMLFIGYSLSDINMRFLLYKLHKVWNSAQYWQTRPQVLFSWLGPTECKSAFLNRAV